VLLLGSWLSFLAYVNVHTLGWLTALIVVPMIAIVIVLMSEELEATDDTTPPSP
jgi:hypothetical protein